MVPVPKPAMAAQKKAVTSKPEQVEVIEISPDSQEVKQNQEEKEEKVNQNKGSDKSSVAKKKKKKYTTTALLTARSKVTSISFSLSLFLSLISLDVLLNFWSPFGRLPVVCQTNQRNQ